MEVGNDMMRYGFQADNYIATYRRYIRLGKMMAKQTYVLSLLVNLVINAFVEETLSIIHFDRDRLYIFLIRKSSL